MDYFAGLDVSVKETSVCIVDDAGKIVREVETRHMRAVLKAQINKTDRNDARGIAQMMRVGLYRLVHVKTLRSQKLRVLLTHRTGIRGAYDWSAPRLRRERCGACR
jgi:hypothetical protein